MKRYQGASDERDDSRVDYEAILESRREQADKKQIVYDEHPRLELMEERRKVK